MFSLIISIVAIALVVAVTIMALSYGGDTSGKGRISAESAKILSQSAQLKLALDRHTLEFPEVPIASLGQLVTEKLMTALPDGWAVADNLNMYTHIATKVSGANVAAELEACNKANAALGLPATAPACDTVASDFAGCCTAP